MSFLSSLISVTNKTRTENNAVAYASTLDACLDFFALGGAKRDKHKQVEQLFSRAYNQDKQTALRILFYLRDIRGGQGERQSFRTCLANLYKNDLSVFEKIIAFVPEYGRWDDLIAFIDNEKVIELIKNQLVLDNQNQQVSLLGKWLPSENCSNQYPPYVAVAKHPHRFLSDAVVLQVCHHPFPFWNDVRCTGTCQPVCYHQDAPFPSRLCGPYQTSEGMHSYWHPCYSCCHHT